MLLESQPELTVVGEAANRAEALEIASREQPDIVVLELDAATHNGLDIILELHAAANQARVLLLNGVPDSLVYHQAVHFGAMGLVHKDQTPDVLFKAIRKIHDGEIWFDRAMMANVLAEMSRAHKVKQIDPEAIKIAELTKREREIIACLGKGLKNKQIAEGLSISEVTVRHHLTSIFNKLDVADRLELMIYAYRQGLATPPC
jgi:DNA-binding NarL/FixJ family response regulator